MEDWIARTRMIACHDDFFFFPGKLHDVEGLGRPEKNKQMHPGETQH